MPPLPTGEISFISCKKESDCVICLEINYTLQKTDKKLDHVVDEFLGKHWTVSWDLK